MWPSSVSLFLPAEKIQHITEVFVALVAGKFVKGKNEITHLRNNEVKKHFNGANKHKLAKQYHLSIRSIERIVR